MSTHNSLFFLLADLFPVPAIEEFPGRERRTNECAILRALRLLLHLKSFFSLKLNLELYMNITFDKVKSTVM